MARAPEVIVFDVNETLSDMSPMGGRFAEAGAPADLARLWFATLLRDGFALAAAGDAAPFGEIGAEVLTGLLDSSGVPDPEGTARRLATSVAELPLHPDVTDGIRALRAAGNRLVTLTNGSAQVAQKLFDAAGIRDEFEALLSVEDAPAWKPHPSSYRYAAQRCGTREEDMLLVAVHPWDIHGAARAGLRTAWVNRIGGAYPSYLARPELTVASLTHLATELAAG
ncbi:haloacid dehalogenase type II [Sinomonas terrae]|uniref:Haloacid dehalogenase type II n=1 Tax=Sinomonas terrae TaxID=2908838 RepID=A0ABS9U149_9MICC|nr:haloacid dehalogenase type II [Sinomonas terrae]MCH6470406.1 haloacid dehalogenase type II [Sinomonas terrae]